MWSKTGILTMSLLKQVVCASVHLGLTSSSVAKSNMVERPQTAELQATTIKLDHRVRDCDDATQRLAPVQINQINCPKIFLSSKDGTFRNLENEDSMGNPF